MPEPPEPRRVVGALIAGGLSTRYGTPKALAEVGGARIVDRVLAALRPAVDGVIAVVNDPSIAAQLDAPAAPDIVPAAGALGGIHAALHRAQAEGAAAVLAVGCDTPFLTTPLLAALVTAWRSAGDPVPDVLAAESGGRRGLEPLCAVYAVTCLPAIERALARGDRRMIAFHDEVTVARLPIDEVRRYGDPARLFLNVNTPADRTAADRLLAAEDGRVDDA
jgi:molybdopterin-guanine dinucleotide biosynthesis protein A